MPAVGRLWPSYDYDGGGRSDHGTDRGQRGCTGAAAHAGGRGEQVAGAATVDEDQGDGDPDRHDVGDEVVEGEGAGGGLEVADHHGGDDERNHVADHPVT